MRRDDYEIFKKGTMIGLLQDCAYYCWQNHQISDDEYYQLDCYCKKFMKGI